MFRYAAQELFGVTLGMDTPLEYKTMRNADFKGDRMRILTDLAFVVCISWQH